MGMTLGQMIYEVQRGSGETSANFRPTIISVIQRKRKIHFRRLKPNSQDDVYDLAVTAGVGEYDLPSTVGHVTKGIGADGREITAMDEREFQVKYKGVQDLAGDVEVIRQFGRGTSGGLKIKCWPVPETAETIPLLIKSAPKTLSSDSDQSEFDDDFDQVVLEDVISYCTMLNSDKDGAALAKNMSQATLKDYMAGKEFIDGGGKNKEIAQDDFVNFRRENN